VQLFVTTINLLLLLSDLSFWGLDCFLAQFIQLSGDLGFLLLLLVFGTAFAIEIFKVKINDCNYYQQENYLHLCFNLEQKCQRYLLPPEPYYFFMNPLRSLAQFFHHIAHMLKGRHHRHKIDYKPRNFLYDYQLVIDLFDSL
jgi:hypothetical protein